ncbi:hypothetical protein ACVWWP_001401 [Bradyrhizobium sp. LM3.6]
MKPAAAPTKASAIVDITAARSQPRGSFGDRSSVGAVMRCRWSLPRMILGRFEAKWSPVYRPQSTSFSVANSVWREATAVMAPISTACTASTM